MALSAEELIARRELVGVLRLTEGITQGELARTLDQAAKAARKRILENLARGNFSGEIRAIQLQAAVNGIGTISRSMWAKIHAQIRAGIGDATDLSAEQAVERLRRLGMPAGILREYGPSLFYNAEQAAQDIISRRTNGFRLAERIYRNGQATIMQVGGIVERGLAQQLSARELAAQVRAFYAADVPGGASYAAKRLARTEINNAHHETTIRLTKDQPWVMGYQWHLSGSHPKPDVCDPLAGFHRKEDVPSKPHPQCLCYLEIVEQPRAVFLRNVISGSYDDYFDAA